MLSASLTCHCTQVALRLWQLISDQANLLTYLGALKDYFLLGRGDFLQAFLMEVTHLLAHLPAHTQAKRAGLAHCLLLWHLAQSDATAVSYSNCSHHFHCLQLVFCRCFEDVLPVDAARGICLWKEQVSGCCHNAWVHASHNKVDAVICYPGEHVESAKYPLLPSSQILLPTHLHMPQVV